jgi:hypothetical protein
LFRIGLQEEFALHGLEKQGLNVELLIHDGNFKTVARRKAGRKSK